MLRAGTDTGSLVNHLHSRAVRGEPEPHVGMGATLLSYTDRSPATVIKVYDVRGVVYIDVQTDTYRRIDSNGMSEMQEYDYTPNPAGYIQTFRKTTDGFWQGCYKNSATGRYNKRDGGLRLGARERYHDFSF